MLNNYFDLNCVFILKKTEENCNVFLKNYEGFFTLFSWKILDEQRKIYSSGIWTCDFRIDMPVLYQLS